MAFLATFIAARPRWSFRMFCNRRRNVIRQE